MFKALANITYPNERKQGQIVQEHYHGTDGATDPSTVGRLVALKDFDTTQKQVI